MNIKPDDIDTTKHLFDSFGRYETEVSAAWVVRLCQKKGNWKPFTSEDINAFYQEKFPNQDFRWNGLLEDRYVIQNNEWFVLTELFVARCLMGSTSRTPITEAY